MDKNVIQPANKPFAKKTRKICIKCLKAAKIYE